MSGNLTADTTIFKSALQAKIDLVDSSTPVEDMAAYLRSGELIDGMDNTPISTELQLRLDSVTSSTDIEEINDLAVTLGKLTNTLPALIEESGGGGSGFRLAPDLNYIANKASAITNAIRISSIDPSAGFATALDLEGKFYVTLLIFGNLNTSGTTDVKLTIDGVLIWDSSITNTSSSLAMFGSTSSTQEAMYCESSLLLEVRKTDDSDIYLDYLARPIL